MITKIRPKLEEPLYSEDAQKIFNAIEFRLIQLCNKITNKEYNAARQYAYWLGFKIDISNALKKIRVKKNVKRNKRNV